MKKEVDWQHTMKEYFDNQGVGPASPIREAALQQMKQVVKSAKIKHLIPAVSITIAKQNLFNSRHKDEDNFNQPKRGETVKP